MPSVPSHQPHPHSMFSRVPLFPTKDTGGVKTGGRPLGFTPKVCKDFLIIFLVPSKVLNPEDRQGTKVGLPPGALGVGRAGSKQVSACTLPGGCEGVRSGRCLGGRGRHLSWAAETGRSLMPCWGSGRDLGSGVEEGQDLVSVCPGGGEGTGRVNARL